jgi:HK97 family phage major capsid protein
MLPILPSVPASVLALLDIKHPSNFRVLAETDSVIEHLRARQNELWTQSQDILARAEAENHRELTDEERGQLDDLDAEFERKKGEVNRREKVLAQGVLMQAPTGRRTLPDAMEGQDDASERPQASAVAQHPSQRPRVEPQARRVVGDGGFRSFGLFAQAVKSANPRFGGELDQRLIRGAAATTYSQEGVGADGGFAVPPDFRDTIMSRVFAEANLISRTDRQTTSSNSITIPVDMTTPWQTTGGVQAYWVGEAQTKTQSKIVLEQSTIKAFQLATLVPVTEELLEDAPALDGYLRRKVPEKIDFKVSMALVWGTGGGQPLGFMNSSALVTQAAEGSQTADTINATNLVRMLARMPSSSRPTAVWLIHPDAEPMLPLMVLGQQPVYLPPGGLSAAGYGTLFGRPVIPHQVCSTLGDLGDIMLVDFNQYMTLLKTGGGRDSSGLRTDVSIHLWFDQDLVAYRFTLRVGGQPWWATPIAMRSGSNTQSPFVTLAAR